MTPTGRIFSKGEEPHKIVASSGPNKNNRYFYLRIGRVLDVDYDRHKILLEWIQGGAGTRWVPLSMPYAGPAGAIGGFPEIGSYAICGFYESGGRDANPLLLTYLPAGLIEGLEGNTVKLNPDMVPNEDVNEIQYRFRKLGKGDMVFTSPGGAGLFVNTDAELSDSMQDSINLSGASQTIVSNSLNNFVYADGVAISAGPIIRNKCQIFDDKGKRIEGTNAREMNLPGGRQNIYIVPFGKPIDYSTQYYSEYRVDVDDLVDGVLDSNDRSPIVSMSLGNYVGSDPTDNNTYGSLLRPVLFSSPTDTKGLFSLAQCIQTNQLDEPAVLGLAYAVHCTQSGAFIGLDKEGHYYVNLPASTNNPMGSGKSMSVLAQGSLKEIWGADSNTANSWDLNTTGGLYWNIGSHNTKRGGRGIEIKTTGSYNLEANADDSKMARQEKIYGNSNSYVKGTKTETITGASIQTIVGLKQEKIQGAADLGYQADLSVNVFGIYTETAMKEKQCKFAKRKTTISAGNDENELVMGSLIENITLGNRQTTVKVGNIEDSILTGNRKSSITAGKYDVSVTTGSMKMNVAVGTAKLGSSISTTISGLTVAAEGTMVKLGKGALKGGIITGGSKPSHYDYVTGAPHKGSFTVTSA